MARCPTGAAREIGSDISPDDDLERVVAVVGSADLRAVQQTIDPDDLDALERAAQAAARARRIDVYGVGGSGAVAQETETRLFRIGCAVRGWNEVHAAATSAALLTPADMAIGISHSGGDPGDHRTLRARQGARRHHRGTHLRPAFAARPDRRHPADLRHVGNEFPHRQHRWQALRARPDRLPLRPGRPALLPARELLTCADRPHHAAALGEGPPLSLNIRPRCRNAAPARPGRGGFRWMNHQGNTKMVV